MTRSLCSILAVTASFLTLATAEEPETAPAQSVDEARGRAQLLYEMVNGALQVMHRDFFDPDDKDRIPSRALEEVFEVMAETRNVELRWLAANAKIMNDDHEPKDDFEKRAVTALAKGAEEFESVEGGKYRYVGLIRLHNECLKCHVPLRTSLEDRAAGVAISMPFKAPSAKQESP